MNAFITYVDMFYLPKHLKAHSKIISTTPVSVKKGSGHDFSSRTISAGYKMLTLDILI